MSPRSGVARAKHRLARPSINRSPQPSTEPGLLHSLQLLATMAGIGSGDSLFVNPDGMAIDRNGDFYVVDRGTSQIKKFDSSGHFLLAWHSQTPPVPSHSGLVRAAADPFGHLYVEDNDAARVEIYTLTGGFLGAWGSSGTGPGQFLNPIGIACDQTGNVYVCDTNNSRVQKFGSFVTATKLMSWGE